MALIWSELASDRDRQRRAEFERDARAMWQTLGSVPLNTGRCLRELDSRLSVEFEGNRFRVLYDGRAARPLAELLIELSPNPEQVGLGADLQSFDVAVERARAQTGAFLGDARVRVGLTRGHLLEVVVTVPLDVEGDDEQLQLAAELFVESAVGERLLDDWVASIEVARSARQKGLLMFQEPAPSTTYPLSRTRELLGLGISGIVAALPDSLVGSRGGEWTALDIPKAEGALQPDRLFASTCLPEALKAALEGLPFHSGRFTRGAEIFVWLAWSTAGLSPVGRRSLRDAREQALARFFSSGQPGQLVGSGFGTDCDYLDLVVQRGHVALGDLVREVVACPSAGTDAGLELGFYDSIWSEERLSFDASGSARAVSRTAV